MSEKRILILQLRPEDEASDSEYDAFLRFGGLNGSEVRRIRMEQGGIPSDVRLGDFAGVIVGGGPYNVSDAAEKKSDAQHLFETQLAALLQEVVLSDMPYLGACYGLGALATCLGARVSKEQYGEEAGAVTIRLTDAAASDPLLTGLPTSFRAFGGHKEACQELPEGAVHLASSETCPMQMFRVKNNVYGVQFHTELDVEGLIVRVNAYEHLGYFKPEEKDALIARAREENITVPMVILRRFVDRCLGRVEG